MGTGDCAGVVGLVGLDITTTIVVEPGPSGDTIVVTVTGGGGGV